MRVQGDDKEPAKVAEEKSRGVGWGRKRHRRSRDGGWINDTDSFWLIVAM